MSRTVSEVRDLIETAMLGDFESFAVIHEALEKNTEGCCYECRHYTGNTEIGPCIGCRHAYPNYFEKKSIPQLKIENM